MNNSTALNATAPPQLGAGSIYEPTFQYTVGACYILIALVAAVGNALVCYAILANKCLRNDPTNLFLLSLAISDFFTATLSMPFDVEFLFLQGVWRHGKVMCITWLTVFLITVPTSILTLLAISVDRFMSLNDPLRRFRRTEFMTQAVSLFIIGIIWGYSIIWALLPLMGWRLKDREPIFQGFCMIPFTKLYSTLNSILNFIAPLLLSCVFFVLAFFIAYRHQINNLHRINTYRSSKQHKEDKETKLYVKNLKATKTTLMFLAAFFFCWQPYTYFSMVSNLYGGEHWNPYPWELFSVLLMFGYLNSALNPFLFAFRNPRFISTYMKLFRSLKPAEDRKSTIRRISTVSQTLSSEIPETDTKEIRLQTIRSKRATPDPPRKHERHAY